MSSHSLLRLTSVLVLAAACRDVTAPSPSLAPRAPALELGDVSAMKEPATPNKRGIVRLSQSRGKPGTTVTVTISGYPPNSTIDLYVSGTKVGTITTNANGTGTGTFTAPDGPKMIPLEIKAQGGTPTTFGYGWFTVTNN